MKDIKYWEQQETYSPFAFESFEDYFDSRSEFDAFVRSITGDEEKSRFLKVGSFYKFLVKDGRFSVHGHEETTYFDETYRFVGLVALIEYVESSVPFKDFYLWLNKEGAFPIQDRRALNVLYERYKSQFGVMHKMVSFFLNLDDSSKQEIETWIKVKGRAVAIDKLAKELYDIRSKFVHEARLVVDLSGVRTVSFRPVERENTVTSELHREIRVPLEQVERIFERGVLLRFGYPAPASWPKVAR